MKGSLKPHFKVAQFRLMSEIKYKPFLRPGLSTKRLLTFHYQDLDVRYGFKLNLLFKNKSIVLR